MNIFLGTKNTVFRDLHALDPASMCWYQGPEGKLIIL